MRSVVLLLCALAVLAAEAIPEPSPSQLVDRSVRYVSGKVITLGDLVDHLQANRPRQAPTTQAEVAAVWRQALERVTDDTLLLLFAEEKGVQLDRSVIAKRILQDLKDSGRLATPDEIGRWRDQLERREKIRAALSFFDERSGNVTPDELVTAYAERREQFRRPARAHVLQYVLRAASDEDLAVIADQHAAWFRRIQELPGPLADMAQARLPDLLAVAGDDAAKAELLATLVTEAAELPDEGLTPAARTARDDAVRLRDRRAALRSRDDVAARIAALRAELLAGDEAAFRAAVIRSSEGPRRDEGGDLGWIERGAFTEVFDAAVFSDPVGTVGEPFWVAEACCLTWVVAREDAAQRSFAEVCGELEASLRRERTDEVFARATGILRTRATVRDLASIDELLAR